VVGQGELGFGEDGKEFIGNNLRAHLDDLQKRMKDAAADLEFEEAARLRDEIKRLHAVELAVADDPFARQSAVDEAVDKAFLDAVRDGTDSGTKTAGKPGQKGSRTRLKRQSRPGVPKTFGSRSK
jgi:excinuclease ABC subunit B